MPYCVCSLATEFLVCRKWQCYNGSSGELVPASFEVASKSCNLEALGRRAYIALKYPSLCLGEPFPRQLVRSGFVDSFGSQRSCEQVCIASMSWFVGSCISNSSSKAPVRATWL